MGFGGKRGVRTSPSRYPGFVSWGRFGNEDDADDDKHAYNAGINVSFDAPGTLQEGLS